MLWISYVKDIKFAPFSALESFVVGNYICVNSEFLEKKPPQNCVAEI
jgi:hypothetical protein